MAHISPVEAEYPKKQQWISTSGPKPRSLFDIGRDTLTDLGLLTPLLQPPQQPQCPTMITTTTITWTTLVMVRVVILIMERAIRITRRCVVR